MLTKSFFRLLAFFYLVVSSTQESVPNASDDAFTGEYRMASALSEAMADAIGIGVGDPGSNANAYANANSLQQLDDYGGFGGSAAKAEAVAQANGGYGGYGGFDGLGGSPAGQAQANALANGGLSGSAAQADVSVGAGGANADAAANAYGLNGNAVPAMRAGGVQQLPAGIQPTPLATPGRVQDGSLCAFVDQVFYYRDYYGDCFLCICVLRYPGYMEQVCGICNVCNTEKQPRNQPIPSPLPLPNTPAPEPASFTVEQETPTCAPLPANTPFTNPLEPCQICICKELPPDSFGRRQRPTIQCVANNQCVNQPTPSPILPSLPTSLTPPERSVIPGPNILPGPSPHESCRPYVPNQVFQHPWDECQSCVCTEASSLSIITIEINCHTKPECCYSSPITPAVRPLPSGPGPSITRTLPATGANTYTNANSPYSSGLTLAQAKVHALSLGLGGLNPVAPGGLTQPLRIGPTRTTYGTGVTYGGGSSIQAPPETQTQEDVQVIIGQSGVSPLITGGSGSYGQGGLRFYESTGIGSYGVIQNPEVQTSSVIQSYIPSGVGLIPYGPSGLNPFRSDQNQANGQADVQTQSLGGSSILQTQVDPQNSGLIGYGGEYSPSIAGYGSYGILTPGQVQTVPFIQTFNQQGLGLVPFGASGLNQFRSGDLSQAQAQADAQGQSQAQAQAQADTQTQGFGGGINQYGAESSPYGVLGSSQAQAQAQAQALGGLSQAIADAQAGIRGYGGYNTIQPQGGLMGLYGIPYGGDSEAIAKAVAQGGALNQAMANAYTSAIRSGEVEETAGSA